MTLDPHSLLTLALDVGAEAGALALRRRREGVDVAATKSSAVDIVTAADEEVEALIRARLAAARPGDGFYGEESVAAESETGLTWVVDPIDGTVNYLYGIPQWGVSIAAVTGGTDPTSWTALAGVVVAPALDATYAAVVGGGATCNGGQIVAAAPVSLAQSLLATGFAYDAGIRAAQAASVATLIGKVRDIRRLGAASIDLCSVAAGRLDAYAERGLQPWDFAAGALIAAEAGAVVDVGDVRADRRLVTAAAPTVAGEFREAIERAGL